MTGPRGPREVGGRIETLLDELATTDPAVRDRSEELVRLLAQMYGEGLERSVTILRDEGGRGEKVLDRLAADPLVSALLALHGLHPLGVQERVNRALDQVRPYLGSHAGGIQLLGIDEEGVARLRLEGSCDGCPSSLLTVRSAVEGAVADAAPELTGIEVEGLVEPSNPAGQGLLQIEPYSPYRDVECPVPVAVS
ncbi:MAG: NifU family protein [Actinomycetes bacterium]